MAAEGEEAADNLNLYWDHFFKAETGTYEKSTWLDLFLAEFLIRVKEGADPKELIKFCPVSGVVSLVGCELLCGIHRVTSSINAHHASSPAPPAPRPPAGRDASVCSGREPSAIHDRDDAEGGEWSPAAAPAHATSVFTRTNAQPAAETLRRYLLGGVAWRCLVLLKALGVEGLSCCRQLSSVLIWVFGELGGGGGAGGPPAAGPTSRASPVPPRTPIHQLFSHKIWSKQQVTGAHGSKANSAGSSEKSYSGGRSRQVGSKADSAEGRTRRKHARQDLSSESADSEDLQLLNRSLAVQVCSPERDFQYFESPVRSNQFTNETLYSDPYYVPKKAKPKADDYMNEKHKEIINSEVTTFEFTLLITDLLQELCRAESGLSGSEGSQISVQCINFTLRNLCSLQFGSLPSHSQYNSQEVSKVKVALTELLIISLDKVLIHSDLCAKLINNGILPMLLRILEDVICKSSTKYRSREDQSRAKLETPSETESENLLKFVFGVGYSITAFFHCLLMQCRTIEKLREFTDQFKLYGECLRGGLLKDCIELMVRLPGVEVESVLLIKKLIESIGRLISGMKRVRSEVVHSAACPRSRHKICRQRVSAGMHHHHDILGEAGTGLPLSSACCISVLYGTLTSLVADDEVSAHSILRNKIIRVMLNCGVCCCFSPGFLMESIVRLMLTQNSVATLCLQLLEHTVYGDLGASVLLPKVTDQLPCAVCEPCDNKRDLVRKYCPHGVNSIERKSVWSFLIHYNSLLQLDNHNNVLHAAVSHLLRVTPRCRAEMKYELLFSVIYPTFIVAKHRYMIRLEESAYFLTVSCLNIFASLLNTVTFAEQFIQKGGLSYVLELVSLAEFSNQCCSILEIAIIVEIFKLIKENSDMTYFREMSSLSSVQMLLKSLSDMTEKCYKIYKMKLPLEKFEELCDVSKERELLAFTLASHSEQQRKPSIPQVIKTPFASSENVIEDSIEDYIEVLKNICTFWKTCASLCLYSPMFREYVASEGVFLDTYALLKLLLHCVGETECGATETSVLIKILEALLTVQFAVSDVTSDRSKETSCLLLRAALAPAAGARGAGARPAGVGGGMRALCEALIRVAVAEPSRTHTMPRLTIAKVPPLGCESGSSSADESASEDSVTGPYASEHSEPAAPRPDEGYEADVEVAQLDVSASFNTRKLSASLSATTSVTAGYHSAEGLAAECGEYTRSGELAHPELCLIVVDILTHLVHTVLTSPETEEMAGAAAGALLARACCARLCGALGGARAAPARLLQRLLAPAAAPATLLALTDDKLEELQRSILELVVAVASRSVSPAELGAYLRLFTARAPPVGLLLAPLRRLAAAAEHNTPDCILTFPINIDSKESVQPLSEQHVPVNSATSQSAQAEACARRLREAHLRAGLQSAWSRGAVRCGVEGAGAGWAPWLQGFALVLWLRTAPALRRPPDAPPHAAHHHADCDEWQSESPEEPRPPAPPKPPGATLAHLFSAGHESLLFEVWLDTNTGYFTFRLSRPEPGANKVVSEARVEGAGGGGLPPHRWACVALNVCERVHKRRIHIEVTLYINGCECETVSLPLQGILVRKVTPTNVLIGDAVRAGAAGGGGVYHVSHVSVYREPVLSAYSALHLTAHGPDHACQVRCESPNFPILLTPNVLNSIIDWDQVYKMSNATLRKLHDNLLLTFSAHAPDIMNLYHHTAAMPTVFAGRVGSTASLMGSGSAGAGGGAGGAVPEALATAWAGAPLASRHRGLAPAVYMLGGPDVLLYLFARVVELEGSAEEQATALGVVLRVCRADARLHAALHGAGAGALELLHTVLAAHKCRLHHHMLKVILDEACSSSILTSSSGGIVVCARPDTVLVEPRFLVLLTRAWRYLDTHQEVRWEVESASGAREAHRGSLWALTLCCVRVLAARGDNDGDHPRHGFNHYQMSRVDLLGHILTACKERFLNSECGPLDPPASTSLVEVVRGLLGAPPLLDRLALLCDFLLLMHQASDTFVTHSRANFYFLLTSETQETSQLTHAPARRRAPRRLRTRPSSDVADTRSSSSVTSEDVINDNSVNATQTEERLDNSSVDSTNQLKGNNNVQIKEGRKHNISSTSETSDLNVERTGGACAGRGEADAEGAGEADIELTEYVVVDEEEVRRAAAGELYPGGLYQQRVVRAGAEPGWTACEGLLLVLRDTVAVLPDDALAQAVGDAALCERVVVLCNHRAASVRAAAVRVLAALQRRAAADRSAALYKKMRAHNYYLHLANQISLYPGSWDLAAACAGLVTECDAPLDEQLDEESWRHVSEEGALRSPPLLALLPRCLQDVPLAHNITLLIRRIIDKSSLKLLIEVSVAEVVVRSVREVGFMRESFEGRELLLEDLYELLAAVAGKVLAAQHSMQTIIDIHHMLTYIEVTDESGAGAGGGARAARDAQLALFAAQLDQLEERLQCSYQHHTKYTNYFTTVLSTAVSLGSEAASRGERGELAARHLATAVRAVNFLLTRSPAHATHTEAALVDRLLATLLPAVSGLPSQRPKWWVSSGAEWASPLQELFWWAASPAGGARALQPALLRALYLAPPAAVQLLTPSDPPAIRKLAVYLLTILKHVHGAGERGPLPVELAVTDWARGWAVGTQAGLPDRLPSDTLPDEAERLLAADEERWARAAAKQRHALAKAVFGKEGVARAAAEGAMGITRAVVDAQNGERKRFMEHLRREHSEAGARALRWRRLVDEHTHEQAVWHEAHGYPQSWQLDATEGPGRVRVRLRRAHLNIHPRFLKPHARHKAETIHMSSPLRSVVGCTCGARGALVARLRLHETVCYMARVTYVTVASETPGELLLSDRCIHFVPEDSAEEEARRVSGGVAEAHSWPLEGVVQVAARRWCLQERAAELFLSSGHAHLLAFADLAERNAFLKALGGCHLPNRTEPDTLAEAMAEWRSGAITNWEYVMRLNGLAGRSYNDLMQYPVLPFVIADYSSRILSLHHPASFRDLARPMAIQNKSREQHYINTYNDLKAARREGCSPLLSRAPHHYPSLYSNSGGVLHYLVRLPPFTELFLNYQDNNFDMPDRTFHSLATTWRLITQDSPTDVKELIPELFYLPELFHNNEALNLGTRQCGAPVDDVELPAWAADARLFTLIHRQALEAAHVTEGLPHWVDLVFGYKQTGQPAIDALNVFPACTYYGFDPLALEDELDRTAAAAMVRTYGQAPRQLLRAPHPHAAPDLVPAHTRHPQMSVWSGVEGARWGVYCGSPALPPAAVVARRGGGGGGAAAAGPGAALHMLPHARTVAVAPRAAALVALTGDAGSNSNQSGHHAGSLALLSWGHSDNIVRLKRRRDARPDLLLHVPPIDRITKVSSSCAAAGSPSPVFIGHASGRVLCVRFRAPAPAHAHAPEPRARLRQLHAHCAEISDIHVCARAGLLATASADGKIVLWDLNDLSYIRTLPNRDMLPVTHVTISATLCDVATVHAPRPRPAPAPTPAPAPADAGPDAGADSDSYEKDDTYKYQSLIRVHTVNARFVGSVKVGELVTCVCYSGAPEGVSVNCVAAGLGTGGVRLYSSWDLRKVAYIPPADRALPLTSLTYSSDSSLLFGCYADGAAVAWESGAGAHAHAHGKPAPVRILPAHALA